MLTVFTPTYSRAYSLPRLYESLKAQTFVDFEWLIVDDGSTDGTKQLIEKWSDEDSFIRYYRQERGGKHRAINLGVQQAKGDLFFIVDSDEYLPDG
ncbi:MAG: glycosyltransferase family 2 protein [Prevotella sp.]|nr:glycosyltransferase family 2 protein [Prevotella sp.]